ncbi:MAG: hypothetical protein JW839_11930 [Candidatus Lokiarchaeota archaeon]|nr:hypothetical protein [Candidatus Lokiarchaeota archaeon]
MKSAATSNDVSVEEIVELVPSLARFVKGSSFILPRKNDSCYIVKGLSVFYLKRRCLYCLHFRQAKGCGIGSDCKSICLIPEESSTKGWTNIEGAGITAMHLLVLAKIFTLVQESLPDFIKEQVPDDFFATNCKKFIRIQPIVYRMLLDLDKQEEEVEAKFHEGKLPAEHKEKFMAEILAEKTDLLDRLALVI